LNIFERLVIGKIKIGTVNLGDLNAVGAVQLGLADGDLAAVCPVTAHGCVDVYAVSIPGVTPSRFLNWFQAAAAARNSGKRLPTNAEWQVAALGTPDPGGTPGAEDCNTVSGVPDLTGARSNCVSDAGAFDMVGNIEEWVADWVPRSSGCGSWGAFSDDAQCLAGAASTGFPGALHRGGAFNGGTGAGIFSVVGFFGPSPPGGNGSGFRAAR
jgi:formylglycine-generating enzyme required for sulfatase activity